MKQKFGVHASIAGGLHNALLTARRLHCDCLQIFVKNQRQWEAPPLTDEQTAAWRAAWQENPCAPVLAHGTYLVNLAAGDPAVRKRSIRGFSCELRRCDALGVDALITHPGSHGGDGEARGIRRVIAALREILARTADCRAGVLLEVTAGQGHCLGYRLEHLAEMIAGIAPSDGQGRLGVCLDTCHLHAAGYDLAGPEGCERMLEDLERHIGVENVRCIHTNDSVKPAGSRVDRHAPIGAGTIGLEGFRRLLRDKRLVHVPRILETPKGTAPDGREYDVVNLETLRTLAGPPRRRSPAT